MRIATGGAMKCGLFTAYGHCSVCALTDCEARLEIAVKALRAMGDIGCKCGDIADEALRRLGEETCSG